MKMYISEQISEKHKNVKELLGFGGSRKDKRQEFKIKEKNQINLPKYRTKSKEVGK